MTRFAVDALDLVLALLRDELETDGVTVRGSIPDGAAQMMPLVTVRRTSGSSVAPNFYDDPVINVQCWAAPVGDVDGVRGAADLADRVRRILWTAWREQTVTDHGHIAGIDEHTGPLEVGDVDLPYHGRYSATYRLRLRNPQP